MAPGLGVVLPWDWPGLDEDEDEACVWVWDLDWDLDGGLGMRLGGKLFGVAGNMSEHQRPGLELARVSGVWCMGCGWIERV